MQQAEGLSLDRTRQAVNKPSGQFLAGDMLSNPLHEACSKLQARKKPASASSLA